MGGRSRFDALRMNGYTVHVQLVRTVGGSWGRKAAADLLEGDLVHEECQRLRLCVKRAIDN